MMHADLLGVHNDEVIKEVAGLSEADIAALYRDKVLVRDSTLEGKKSAAS